jgi:hypothetical protein
MLLLFYKFKKLKKNECFCIFLRSCDIFRHFPPMSPRSYIPDPRRHFPRHEIYSIDISSNNTISSQEKNTSQHQKCPKICLDFRAQKIHTIVWICHFQHLEICAKISVVQTATNCPLLQQKTLKWLPRNPCNKLP